MRAMRGLIAAAALFLAVAGTLPVAHASEPAQAHPAAHVDQARDVTRTSQQELARQAATAAATFRESVRTSLAGYLQMYGSRLSADERQRMDGLARQADQDLSGLVSQTRQVARLVDQGKRSQASRKAGQATLAYQEAYAKALATLQQVQPILQPKLGLFEAIQAKADMDAQLDQFGQVGALIEATDQALKAP